MFDPNKALKEIRELASNILMTREEPDGMDLARRIQALDEHLTRAGYLPGAWAHNNSQILQGILNRPAGGGA